MLSVHLDQITPEIEKLVRGRGCSEVVDFENNVSLDLSGLCTAGPVAFTEKASPARTLDPVRIIADLATDAKRADAKRKVTAIFS